MRLIRSCSPLLLSLLLFAACGGSDPEVPGSGSPSGAPTTKGSFTAVVSFGDSLSDVGAYAPATSLAGNGSAPYFGGRFTTNGAVTATGTDTKIWVENIATTMGLAITPHEVGFGASSVKCPAAAVPALASTCTGYGMGGSRITDPNGINHSGGALTVPVVTQIANHLTRFTSFKESDLIFVFGGPNDVFAQFGIFGAKAGQANADAAAGKITPQQANDIVFAAQVAAQAEMKKAALELTGYIKTEILAKGGKYVAVVNVPDSGDTPFGNSAQVGTAKAVLSLLATDFNTWLREGLTGQPVQIIDAYSIFKSRLSNPAQYGFSNNTTPACDAAKIAAITGNKVLDGSSLFCNSTTGAPYNGLRTGADPNTWFFADSVHPTTGGHKLISDAFYAALQSYGWL